MSQPLKMEMRSENNQKVCVDRDSCFPRFPLHRDGRSEGKEVSCKTLTLECQSRKSSEAPDNERANQNEQREQRGCRPPAALTVQTCGRAKPLSWEIPSSERDQSWREPRITDVPEQTGLPTVPQSHLQTNSQCHYILGDVWCETWRLRQTHTQSQCKELQIPNVGSGEYI